jgi:hypothetical protein
MTAAEKAPPPQGGRRKADDDAAPPADPGGYTHHALFPTLADSGKRIHSIRVSRFRARDASWSVVPRAFEPSELGDLAALQEMLGGGRYELWGLNAKSQIVCKQLFVLDGAEKPFPGVGEAAPAPAAAPSLVGASSQDLVPLMLQMMMQQSAAAVTAAREDARAREESSKQFTTLMLGMFDKIGNRPDTVTPMLAALAPVLAPLVERLGTPAKSSNLKELVEVAQLLGGAKARVEAGDASSEGEMAKLAESMGVLMAGFATMKEADAKVEGVKAEARKVEAGVEVAKANAMTVANLARVQQQPPPRPTPAPLTPNPQPPPPAAQGSTS